MCFVAAVKTAPLTLVNRKSAQVCYDIATLQPVYNQLATFIVANATGLAASPASTVAVFGQAYGKLALSPGSSLNHISWCAVVLHIDILILFLEKL